MKKLFLFILAMIGCMGMEAQSRYTISGNVVGLEDGELSLVVLESEMLKILNRAQVANGKFLFSGEVDSVVLVGILTSKKELVAELMLENADFGVLSGGVVTGGGNAQKLLEKFNALNVELAVERQKLEDEYQMAEQKKNKREMAAIDARYQEFLVNVQERESELLRKNADTYVAAYVVASTMKDIDLEKLEERYDILGEHAKITCFGKAVARQIEKCRQVEVNGVAPDFKLASDKEGIVGLYDTKAKAKIVYFWTFWNQASRDLNVELISIYQQYYPQGLSVIGISLDGDEQEWRRAMGEDGITWLSCRDSKGEVADLYCVRSLPTLFLLDADNNIVAKNLYGSDLRKRLVDILKEK